MEQTQATRNPFTQAEAPAIGVSIAGLCKNFGDASVLHDISLEVKPGEVFVLMGPSGSGKSVLLRHVAGLESPTSGTVAIDGSDPALEETRERVRLALVFQDGALFNSLSVYDNMALYLREHRLGSEEEIRRKVERALQILSLGAAAGKFPSELSGGMKKRVSIARALVMEPQLLLYDEPTSELDPVMSATISEIIGTLRREYKVTSVVVSHDRDLALSIADRVGIIMEGRLISVSPPSELHPPADPRIADFFNPKIDLDHPRFKQLATQETS